MKLGHSLVQNYSPQLNFPHQADFRCSAGKGFGVQKGSEADVVLSAIDEVSKASGRKAGTLNLVLGIDGDGSDEEWHKLDEKVNEYPQQRDFRGIGTGGEDFKNSMVAAVERAVQREVPAEAVSTRPSSKGNYISVAIGPITINSGDEVLAIFTAMKEDPRLRWLI
eukprot:CAMPEP_0196575128 /NCGR_PEP_ID=MMETSP1081-20130531/4677_1 /TAXON_ID=36882 /ORGANISM="Pyramimonas amylifera, Strain CCMP720" /LENGTH=165 /DNA_ID=CAMNT_0041893331 /DNA_START=112 /DNA_END=609 /DNA_ORIENTATION=+